ncbi:hypothetical protein [Bradyrhizobium roseum]|uniref:hypothetical protein n=1 Tax=Bradyrhizobium roseum TaxID=3056648 RepID=UPI002625C002|nr:hypothetical protein [Bradyrhizobium roseus]WKA25676.1 hypothetical protein QUH67_18785 [Bradyrhizobium roseus]
MSQIESTFLNVDLDLHGSAADIEQVISAVTPSVVVMRHEGGDASLELAEQFSSAESTLQAIAELIQALPCDARSAWDRLEYRRADIGLQIGSRRDARQLTGAISLKVLGLMVGSGLELAYTVYAPIAD